MTSQNNYNKQTFFYRILCRFAGKHQIEKIRNLVEKNVQILHHGIEEDSNICLVVLLELPGLSYGPALCAQYCLVASWKSKILLWQNTFVPTKYGLCNFYDVTNELGLKTFQVVSRHDFNLILRWSVFPQGVYDNTNSLVSSTYCVLLSYNWSAYLCCIRVPILSEYFHLLTSCIAWRFAFASAICFLLTVVKQYHFITLENIYVS